MATMNTLDLENSQEEFEALLAESSGSEEEEMEELEFLEDDSMEFLEEEYLEEEFFDSMNTVTPDLPENWTLRSMYDEKGVEIPVTSSLPCTSTTLPAQYAEPHASQINIAVFSQEEDGTAADHFHLADEHELFPPVQGTPQRGRGRRRLIKAGQRGLRRGIRRGQKRGNLHEMDGTQWVKGDKLVEIYLNDEDIPIKLKQMIMDVVNAREIKRERARARARRLEAPETDCLDAANGEDDALLAEGNESSSFEWSSMNSYQSNREKFLPQHTGAVIAPENALDAFRQYWDDDILSYIATETNRYAARLASSSGAFARGWYDTNVHEILILFSFWMMLGIIRMPTKNSCFTTNPLLQTSIFGRLFTRARYENLCRALHFNDNSARPPSDSNRLFCLGPILEHLNSKFMHAYVPSQNICVDESLIMWKGNLSFRQYIRTKVARFGVKTFELCESSTGYLWSFFVYIGSNTIYRPDYPSTLPKTTATVLTLIHPLLDKGYTLFLDSWFNNPILARFLKSHKTDCVGTLRGNRCNVPPIMSMCKLKEGQFIARHSGDVCFLAYQDKKRKIITISTYHGTSQGLMPPHSHRQPQYKPQIILDYNQSMGGVDKKDQMLEPYLIERKKCAKWNMKIFKRLLNCSILNSRILLHSSNADPQKHLVFRLQLVQEILKKHLQNVPKVPISRNIPKTLRTLLPASEHWVRRTSSFTPSGRIIRRRCVWCSQRKHTQKRTTFECAVCGIPLCVDPCFKLYHTNPGTIRMKMRAMN